MIKLLKITAINILVFLGLLVIADLTVISVHQLTHSGLFSYLHKKENDFRCDLPNYKNVGWAPRHFQEYHELHYEYVSYIGWRALPYTGQTINIDKEGFRNTPQSDYAAERSPMVVFLGGSTMFGAGADDANTIPAHFALIARGHYGAINLGEVSYNAFQEYILLQLQMIKGLNPRVVVSYDGVNDAKILREERRPFSHSRENQIRDIVKGQDRGEDETLSFGYFLFNPLRSFIAKYKIDKLRYNVYEISREDVEKKATVLLESWLCTKELAESHGAYFIAVLQPNAGVGKPNLRYLNMDTDMASFYKVYYAMVLKLLKTPRYQKLSKNFLDLTDAFNSEEYIYIDDSHVSPNGNKIIAQKIYDHIGKLNIIKNR